MYSILLLSLFSFVLGLILTPLVRETVRRLKVLDHPDNFRKLHARPIPRAGGAAILFSYLGAFALLMLLPVQGSTYLQANSDVVNNLLPAVILVFLTGLVDDLLSLKPWQKFAGQAVAAGLAYAAGVRILFGVAWMDAWLSLPLTVIWLVGCSNAFNLIDGLDGLAAGIGFFATLTMLVAGLLHGNVPLVMATAPLAGALLAFLCFNFNPASIFLGDSGSLLIGFTLGCFGIIWSQKSTTLIGMTAPMMALAIPLLDTGLAMARRFLRRRPLFSGDRGHIHHRLLDRGFSPGKVAMLLYGVCLLGAALSLASSVFEHVLAGPIILVFAGMTALGVYSLGYIEFDVARRMFQGKSIRRDLHAAISLRQFELSLQDCETYEDAWLEIVGAAREFGFSAVELHCKGRKMVERLLEHSSEPSATLMYPLEGTEYLLCRYYLNSNINANFVAPFAQIARVELLSLAAGRRRAQRFEAQPVEKAEAATV